MKFQRLRLAGFKSFVEATDFEIRPGLTGIVGPNGCGKSNLVEALRWVMGENSYKNMRASGMDDVIFSGSGNRPARNIAEVSMVLDNSERKAPAGFNGQDRIEIIRRIEREEGSIYKFNGRDVRARDVQLLFADSSSGARSPSMVRQGQIGEIIAAKPQQRRRILEEAAGISGLYARRHEAELRLRGAEDNLTRLEDVAGQFDLQIDALKHQARQAKRYRALAAEIRRAEALLFYISHEQARDLTLQAKSDLTQELANVAERMRHQSQTARDQAVAQMALPQLRDEEVSAAALLQRLLAARQALDGEEQRTSQRLAEIALRLERMHTDQAREQALIDDAQQMVDRLDNEEIRLAEAQLEAQGLIEAAQTDTEKAEITALQAEKLWSEAQHQQAQTKAQLSLTQRVLSDEQGRHRQISADIHRYSLDKTRMATQAGTPLQTLQAHLDDKRKALEALQTELTRADQTLRQMREAEHAARAPLSEADRKAQRLETELRTLEKVFSTDAQGKLWPSIADVLEVDQGYEIALGAALGEDLQASNDAAAPSHFIAVDQSHLTLVPLPGGTTPLAQKVRAPLLAARLNQIGIVAANEGAKLQAQLQPGQRLVSLEGDLWRWDGFVVRAGAPNTAARRLAERNRLADLRQSLTQAKAQAQKKLQALQEKQALTQHVSATETNLRMQLRKEQSAAEQAREILAAAERQQAQQAAKLAAIEATMERLKADQCSAQAKISEAEQTLKNLEAEAKAQQDLEVLQARSRAARTDVSEKRAAWSAAQQAEKTRQERKKTLASDRLAWQHRLRLAHQRVSEQAGQIEQLAGEHKALQEAPDTFLLRRHALLLEIDTAEVNRKQASDARTAAETGAASADHAAKTALEVLGSARETVARAQAHLESMQQRSADLVDRLNVMLECTPEDLLELTGLTADAPVPERAIIEAQLERFRQDRERLGAVNLRADIELATLEQSKNTLDAERQDIIEAVKRLRQAISSLNREGRERLQAAFTIVSGHFAELYQTLFDGGDARLELIESDDPLEAGLEIIARPPGKRPQTMTLLSGGEQALTAMALIFAVFLTNPSPICVLDEVDAPLDDANVERFCNLLQEMQQRTQTPFLTITHNPITMARMNRLYGVTMVERGVSQLVSVDLDEAERLVDAS